MNKMTRGHWGDADLWIGAGTDEEGVSMEEVDEDGETAAGATAVELESVIPVLRRNSICARWRTARRGMF